MKIIISNNLRIQNASDKFKYHIKNRYTLPNPEYHRRFRMGLFCQNLPKNIKLYEMNGDEVILPMGAYQNIDLNDLISAEVIANFVEERKVDYKANIDLYDYQQKAVDVMYQRKMGILESRAGSGKTQMGIGLIAKHGVKALWITHTLDLLKQSQDRARRYIKDDDLIGTIASGKVNISKGITFATIQTLGNLDIEKYKNEWDLVIVDECHHISGSPTNITRYYKVLNTLAARYKYGLTATVHRADMMIEATYALIGNVIHKVNNVDIGDKVMNVGIYPIYTGIAPNNDIMKSDGCMDYVRLITYLINNKQRNMCLIEAMYRDMEKPSIVLSERVKHIEILYNMMPKKLKDRTVLLTSKQKQAERAQNILDMQCGNKKFLLSTFILTREGLDIPILENLYLATPVKDYSVVTQAIGRIARKTENKGQPTVYDFVDDMIYLQKSFRQRCSIYKKNDCIFIEEQ